MKKNKIAIFGTIALLAVGTVFGANKLRGIHDVPAYIIESGVCTEITCSTQGTQRCKPVPTVIYSNNACTVIADDLFVPDGVQ